MLIVEEKDFNKLEELGFSLSNSKNCYYKQLQNIDFAEIYVNKCTGQIGQILVKCGYDFYMLNSDGLEELYDFLSLDIVKRV